MTNTINVSFESLQVEESRGVRALKPDSDGLYKGFPLAVLDHVSRNKTYYESKSFLKQLSTPTPIKIALDSRSLLGELDHPKCVGKPNQAYLRRILDISQDRVSHFFSAIYAAETLSSGGIVIRGDIKPYGMYKNLLEDSLMDPHVNTSFSLRSITKDQPMAGGAIKRFVQRLVTFDFVGTGGFEEASKMYAPACESVSMGIDDLFNENNGVSVEEIKDKDILELFGAKTLVLKKKTIGLHIPKTSSYIDDNGRLRSTFHQMIKR